MNGIREIFSDTIIGTTGGTIIVYTVCIGFIFMLLRFGMIRNVLTDPYQGGDQPIGAGERDTVHHGADAGPRCRDAHGVEQKGFSFEFFSEI